MKKRFQLDQKAIYFTLFFQISAISQFHYSSRRKKERVSPLLMVLYADDGGCSGSGSGSRVYLL